MNGIRSRRTDLVPVIGQSESGAARSSSKMWHSRAIPSAGLGHSSQSLARRRVARRSFICMTYLEEPPSLLEWKRWTDALVVVSHLISVAIAYRDISKMNRSRRMQ